MVSQKDRAARFAHSPDPSIETTPAQPMMRHSACAMMRLGKGVGDPRGLLAAVATLPLASGVGESFEASMIGP
jgi:hypothetical protein